LVREYPLTPSGKIQKPVLRDWIMNKRILPVAWHRPASQRAPAVGRNGS